MLCDIDRLNFSHIRCAKHENWSRFLYVFLADNLTYIFYFQEEVMLTRSQFDRHVFEIDKKISSLVHSTLYEADREDIAERLSFLLHILETNTSHTRTRRDLCRLAQSEED